ncbi:hypothetical protein HYH03_005608 [Edaphochlamys debaryana]|uniref:Uncharacterized protein n=1 Tax=Edaphochlamys debaryana TaxID=47281 RepID=A0A835Y589_9CHLO|nr:hypothetical protein HYH03_005608 [Edaphochlamys debaryana]|eukprot:KAG2496380.1 hypothetical protein HYH03_005608 [Edaphochlamys debaryana]
MLGALPVFPAVNSSISVTGTVTIFTYLDGNCTDRATTAPDVNLQVTLNGQPYANRQINGYGFTGNCSAPGDLYRNNVTRGDDRFNLVYWYKEHSMTDENGTTWGAAPNVFVLREPSAPNALRSIVLYPSPADSAPVCCNLVYNEPAPADFLTQGSFCRVPAPPPPSPPSPHSPPPKSSHNPPPRRRPPPRRMHNRRLF